MSSPLKTVWILKIETGNDNEVLLFPAKKYLSALTQCANWVAGQDHHPAAPLDSSQKGLEKYCEEYFEYDSVIDLGQTYNIQEYDLL